MMRKDDVFSIGSGKCLGRKDTEAADVPHKIEALCGIKISGNFNSNSVCCAAVPEVMEKFEQEFTVETDFLSSLVKTGNCLYGDRILVESLALGIFAL